ncbi:TonB-dependent receptor [soil metagenome]
MARLIPLVLCLMFVAFTAELCAQGVTTGSLSGLVRTRTDKSLTNLSGATVRATHEPTGAVYGAIVRSNGRFTIRGMRGGGPYTVAVSFVGYKTVTRSNIAISLGETFTLDFELDLVSATTKEVVITAGVDDTFDKAKMGSGSVINSQTIALAPTINRSISDMARINPYANQVQSAGNDQLQAISIAGVNSRFNNIQIDGAVANDMFALSNSGTSGGQANANFLSLDAIEELRVNVSPYDVRQSGFTGGLINAITKGGTNDFRGSVFFFGRNEDLVGLSPDANRTKFDQFKDLQFGGRLGGPIIKNKLLFHITAEARLRDQPVQIGLNDPNALNNFPVSTQTLDEIIRISKVQYGYDPGTYSTFVARNNSINVIGRLDWNIDESNKIQIRHNFTNAILDRNVLRTNTSFSLSSQANTFQSVNNQTVLQWNSMFGGNMANEMRMSYTQTSDNRLLSPTPFPQIQVTVGSNLNVVLGPERNSQANALDQKQVAFTNDFNVFLDDHTFTLGTHNELSFFNNLFMTDYYGSYQYPSVASFADSTANWYRVSWANAAVAGSNPQPRAAWSMVQTGLYAMDEWQIEPALRVTYGLRVDVPIMLSTPYENPTFAQRFAGKNTSTVPSAQFLFSPRAGFNWDVSGDRTFQIRGGTGVFTGRVAAVWLANQYSNTGMDIYRGALGGSNSPNVIVDPVTREPISWNVDPLNPPKAGDPGYPGTISTSAINITDPSFRMPQVWRSTLGADIKLTKGVTLTVEGMYGKFLNQVDFQNINLRRSGMLVSPLDGRPMYAGASADSLVAREFTDVIVMRTRSEGYQYSTMAQVSMTENNDVVPGITSTLSYTFGHTYDLNSGQSSTATSQWSNTDVVDPNNAAMARSNFDVPHRIVFNASYRLRWSADVSTTVGVFYAGQSGRPYSMSYIQDYNGDNASGGNDLIYVPRNEDFNSKIVVAPTSSTDFRTPEQIWGQIMALIDANPALKAYQGQILPRNELREPWINQLDIRFGQRINIEEKRSLEFTLDIQNVLNLLNTDWGLQRYVNFQSANIFGLNTASGKPFDSQGRLRMTYNEPVTNGRSGIYTTDNFYSRWRMQLGVRFNF